jgi:hypothetical protein
VVAGSSPVHSAKLKTPNHLVRGFFLLRNIDSLGLIYADNN